MLRRITLVIALVAAFAVGLLQPVPAAEAAPARSARVTADVVTPKKVPATVVLRGVRGKHVRIVLSKGTAGTRKHVHAKLPAGTYRVTVLPVTVQGVRYVGSSSARTLHAHKGTTSTLHVRMRSQPGVKRLGATTATTSVRLSWASARGVKVVVRRATGAVAPKSRTAGRAVPVKKAKASDSKLKPSTRYSYSVFVKKSGHWYGPQSLLVRTQARAGATEATYVAAPSTVFLAGSSIRSLRGTSKNLFVSLTAAAAPPSVGSAVILQPRAGLSGGYVGVVRAVDAAGRMELVPAGLGDAFASYHFYVPAFTSDAATLPLVAVRAAVSGASTATAKKKQVAHFSRSSGGAVAAPVQALRRVNATKVVHPAATRPSRVSMKCTSGDSEARAGVSKSLALGGKFDLQANANRAKVDIKVFVKGSLSLDAAISTAAKCAVALPEVRKTVEAGDVPIGFLLEPKVVATASGKASLTAVGATLRAGFRVQGTAKIVKKQLQLSEHTSPIKQLDAMTPSLDARVDVSLKVGGSLLVGPGISSDVVGALAGVRGDLDLVDGKFELAAATDGTRVAACMRVQAGLSAALSLEARAWLHTPVWSFDKHASIKLVGMANPIPYFPTKTIPQGCDPDAPLAPAPAPSSTPAPSSSTPTSTPSSTPSPSATASPQPTGGSASTDDSTNGLRHLTSVSTDADLNCSMQTAEDEHTEYFDETACGTFLAANGTLYGPEDVPAGESLSAVASPEAWTPVSQQTTGTGTTTDPYLSTTTVAAGDSGLLLVQQDRWVANGSQVLTRMTLQNTSGSAVPVHLSHAFDCYLANDDTGTSALAADTSTASCLGNADDVPLALRLRALTPGASVAAQDYDSIWTQIGQMGDLSNAAATDTVDNGAGVAWSATLPATSSVTFEALTSIGAQ